MKVEDIIAVLETYNRPEVKAGAAKLREAVEMAEPRLENDSAQDKYWICGGCGGTSVSEEDSKVDHYPDCRAQKWLEG